MDHDSDLVKKQLMLQGIDASDEDIRHVQRILTIIRDGQGRLESFPDLEDEKIALRLDMEVLAHD